MILMNGQLYAPGAPEITLLNRSFKYGDSLFETLRVYEGRLPMMELHLDRLKRGLKVLKIACDWPSFSERLQRDIHRLLQQNQVTQHGSVRVQVYRSGGGAYAPIQNEPFYLIEAHSLKEDPFRSPYRLHLIAYKDILLHYDLLSPFKTGNALPYVLAAQTAREKQADDAVLFSSTGIADTAGANLFLIRNQKIITPPLASGCLDGVMRRRLLALCGELKLDCAEKRLKEKDLRQADEVFLTNSIRGIMEVGSYEEVVYPQERALTQFLKNCLNQWLQG